MNMDKLKISLTVLSILDLYYNTNTNQDVENLKQIRELLYLKIQNHYNTKNNN